MRGASLSQVRAGRHGRFVEIDRDVLDVCHQIREIDRSLGVDWNDDAEYFRVYQLVDGQKHTVTTALELNGEVVERIRRIAHPSYDLGAELERLDNEADRENEHRFREQVGEFGERLLHAARKDLQVQNQVFLPRGVEA